VANINYAAKQCKSLQYCESHSFLSKFIHSIKQVTKILAVNVFEKYGKITLEATGHELKERHLWQSINIFW
jgi:hypothetical protein